MFRFAFQGKGGTSRCLVSATTERLALEAVEPVVQDHLTARGIPRELVAAYLEEYPERQRIGALVRYVGRHEGIEALEEHEE